MPLPSAARCTAMVMAIFTMLVCASTAMAATHRWNGALDRNLPTHLSFNVGRTAITNFTIPIIGCTSLTGYQVETLHIPSIPVRKGKVSIKYHPPKTPKIVVVKVTGKFKGSEFIGTVTGSGFCGTGAQAFHANLGKFKPVKVPKPKTGPCTAAKCLASNGMLISITGLDTGISSIDDAGNIYDSSADPFLAHGGVGLAVTGTNTSTPDPTSFVPAANFQLRLGSGSVVQADPTLATVVSSSHAPFACSDGSVSESLARSASFGPTKLCFDATSANDRQHLTLYYMPDGSDVLAKIPLS